MRQEKPYATLPVQSLDQQYFWEIERSAARVGHAHRKTATVSCQGLKITVWQSH